MVRLHKLHMVLNMFKSEYALVISQYMWIFLNNAEYDWIYGHIPEKNMNGIYQNSQFWILVRILKKYFTKRLPKFESTYFCDNLFIVASFETVKKVWIKTQQKLKDLSKFRQKNDFSDLRIAWKVSVFGVILVTFYAVPANPKQTILELGSTALFYISFPVSHLIRKEIKTTIFYHFCTKNCLIINIYNIIINVYNWRGFHQFFLFLFLFFFALPLLLPFQFPLLLLLRNRF